MKLFDINKLINKPLKLVYFGDKEQAIMTQEALETFKLKLNKADFKTLTEVEVDPATAAYLTDFDRIITQEDL